MKILLLGSGGRESALAWKLSKSPHCKKLFIAPGNAGTDAFGENVPLNILDFEALKKFCLEQKVEMVVVGPEEPLVLGIWDAFHSDKKTSHIAVIGPSAEGARLEGSKAFAKEFMQEYNIPTAAYGEFDLNTLEAGLSYIDNHSLPIVLKANGLAAGKGVLICESREEAKTEFRAMLGGKFGKAGTKVVIEQFLSGIEFSVFVLTDGKSYKILPVAKDYKRIGENDTGLNTGGMGAVSPPPFVTKKMMRTVEQKIIKPTLQGLQERKILYHGFIFLGLIRVGEEPFVIEYNCRLGDPETEVVIPRLKNDLVKLFQKTTTGKLADVTILISEQVAATVIMASKGYPGDYEKEKIISGLEKVEGSMVFQGGSKRAGDVIVTNGGRVLAVTSMGADIKSAIGLSNRNAHRIAFEGKYFRSDIGFDL